MDSLKKRYASKVINNFISFSLSILTAGIIPRSLGVENFGIFNYLTSVFRQILDFLDARTSTCFYVNLSRNQSDKNLIAFYTRYSAFVAILFFMLISICVFTPIHQIIRANTTSVILYLASIYCFLTWISEIVVYIMDAHGHTVILEKIRLINKIFSTGLLFLLFYNKINGLITYFFYQYIIIGLFVFIIILFLYKRRIVEFKVLLNKISNRKELVSVFTKFSLPMLAYLAVCAIIVITERWMLQYFGGSHEQGIFSFAFTLTNLSNLFLTAVHPLIMREISIAISKKDNNRIVELYDKTYPLLFTVTAYICVFVFIEAGTIVNLFGGDDYKAAILSLRILIISPLIYVFSGLNTSIIMATNQTKILLKLSLIFVPFSMTLLYCLLSPKIFNLGAVGYSLKLNIMEFISVVIILFYLAKKNKIKAGKCLIHYVYLIPILLIAKLAMHLSSMSFFSAQTIVRLLFSGIIYTVIFFALIMVYPRVLGISADTSNIIWNKLKIKFDC